MSLTSFTYLAFVFGLAFLIKYLPRQWHWLLLLVSSYYFYYTWNPRLLPVLIAVTVLSFAIPFLPPRYRKSLPFWGAGLLLTPLIYLKLMVWGKNFSPDLLYLIGVSFFTFTAVSYVIDCQRGMIKPTRHLGHYASFLAFFPNLLAGPIEKFKFLHPQLSTLKPLKKEYIEEAILLFMWGWIKKTVVASRLTQFTDVAFDTPETCGPLYILGAVLLFPAQLYADYTGYFDIAKGSALLFGIRLTENFENRIFYLTRKDAWHSWNKTMHAWFRDYFYFPISRLLKGPRYVQLNKIATNVLSGLWHGASFGFLTWGFFQWFFSELPIPGFVRRYPILGYLFTYLTGAFASFWFRVPTENIEPIYSKVGDLSAYHWQFTFVFLTFLKCVTFVALLEVVNRHIKQSLYGYYAQAGSLQQYGLLLVFITLLTTFSLDHDQLFYYFRF